jgi:NAD(P)H-nitrite reductase large subunit
VAARIEDVKAAGIAVDIDQLAASGFDSISDDDKYRLKTQGVCSQRQVGVFMLRIRVPGGKATPAQLRRCADLAETYAHPGLHVTTRGGLELHHAKIEDVPAIHAGLAEVGLTTKGTCGDTIRNVIACAHSGTYAGEVLPLDGFAQLLHDHTVRISDSTNISRKMNVAIACSPHCDEHVATSDIGFVATPEPAGGAPTFTVWGAGGLGATPRLAIELRRGLAQADVLPAFDALVAMGKKYGDRSARAKAKIKLLVDAWGAERVREVFDEEFALAQAATAYPTAPPIAQATTTHRVLPAPTAGSIVPQKQADRFTIPALVPMGELMLDGARALADAAERFGNGFIYLTTDQNAELHDVRGADVAAAIAAIEDVALRTAGRGGISDVVSCVGLEYCPLAVAHSMTMGEEIAQAFARLREDPRYADFRVHVSGCPHSCAKHQVADIGLAGAMTEIDGKRVEAYVFNLGGNARARQLGAVYSKKVPRTRVVHVIEALLSEYEEHAAPGERFSQTLARVGSDVFFHVIAAVLGGTSIPLPAVRAGKLVVIGNGMAGARFVEELRTRTSSAFDVTVLGEEPHGGYNRIMLSGVLGGFRDASEIVTHAPAWYEEQRVTLHRGTAAVAIDRDAKIVTTADGARIDYDALVIATGSRPLVPPIPGLNGPHVYVMRTLEDCERIRGAVTPGAAAVVLGGGLLGLEAASGLRALGAVPTVVHMAPTLMEMQLDADGGRALQARIEALGIVVKTSARAVAAYDDDSGRGIELADGTRIPGELIVVCCGIVPNTALAREAGLAVERGIVVDDGLQTSDPAVFSLGECAQHRGVTYGLVEPLWEQCVVLAGRLTGRRAAYAGSRVGTKLKVAGVNVIALGEREPRPGDESIAAIDANGAYRRGIVRDGMLIGAQVVGDAAAAAALGKAFERGSPLAGTLASTLFGSGAIATTDAAPAIAGDERVCICNEIPRSEIQRAIDGGAHDVAEIGRITLAGTGCGTCRGELASMVIASVANVIPSPSRESHQA